MKYYDLAQEAQNHFPAHGWIAGCSGIKHLRLPILRLYQHGQPTYKRFIENDLGGMWLQCRSPYRTLRQLAIVLRDLQAEIREILPLVQEDCMGVNQVTSEAMRSLEWMKDTGESKFI